MQAKITKRLLDSLPTPAAGEVKVWDTELRGFLVRVRASGRRWFAVEWMRDRRTRRLSLGEFGALTVDQARDRAKKILGRVAHGEDPAAQRAEERAAPTVAELARRYLEEHAGPKKKRSSVEGDERLLRLYVLPALGRRRAAAVGLKDIADLHHSLRAKPVQANRVLALVSKMLYLAETWGLRALHSNPCPRIGRYREGKRERFLSGAELRRLGEALAAVEKDRSEDPGAVLAVRLLLLTGARRDEILGLRWQDVDLDTGTLNLPDSKTGKKSIPLGPAAVELLAAAPRLEGSAYVIPGRRRPDTPFVGIQRPWARIRARAGLGDVRLHDLRHSFASVGVAANLGLPVLGAILGHRHPATTARYAHLDDDPRRAAAARISNQIAADLNGQPAGEVVPFKKP
jgi:integrase